MCMSVPADGIPVIVKTGTTESLCNIPVDVNGRGMFTIDAHVFSLGCSTNFNIDKLFKNEKLKLVLFKNRRNFIEILISRLIYSISDSVRLYMEKLMVWTNFS